MTLGELKTHRLHGILISTVETKSKEVGDESQPKCGAMALCADFLAQLKEFKCLEKKKWGFRSLSALVVSLLCQIVMARKVPHWKAKLSINWLISIANRPSGRELWVVTYSMSETSG